MTTEEMAYKFQRLVETISPEFETTERINTETILKFLNWAYIKFIKDRYLSNGSNKINVRVVQDNSGDLINLIHNDSADITLTPTVRYPTSMLTFTMPSDYFFYVRSDIFLKKSFFPTMIEFEWVPAQIIDYSDVDELLSTTNNKPLIDKPAVLLEDGGMGIVIIDSYTTAQSINMTYIKKPKELSFTSTSTTTTEPEIAEYLHEEIVNLAVDMFINDYKFRLSRKDNK